MLDYFSTHKLVEILMVRVRLLGVQAFFVQHSIVAWIRECHKCYQIAAAAGFARFDSEDEYFVGSVRLLEEDTVTGLALRDQLLPLRFRDCLSCCFSYKLIVID